jgi:hypothetical protein
MSSSQAQNLFPSSFVETEGCEGPRFVRTQPSRETAGVLLSECSTKYITEFELPYRNLTAYIRSLQTNWIRLTDEQKEEVVRDLIANIPSLQNCGQDVEAPASAPTGIVEMMKNMKKEEKFTEPDLILFLNGMKADPNKQVKDLLNAMYRPNDTIKAGVPEDLRKEIYKAFTQWSDGETLYYHVNYKTGILLFLMILLFFLLGIGITMSSKAS